MATIYDGIIKTVERTSTSEKKQAIVQHVAEKEVTLMMDGSKTPIKLPIPAGSSFEIGSTIIIQRNPRTQQWGIPSASEMGLAGGVSATPMELLGSYTFPDSSSATYSFDSIPQAYTHLTLIAILRSVRAVARDEVYLRINGDSSSIYNTNGYQLNSALSANVPHSGTYWRFFLSGTPTSNVPPATAFTYARWEFPFYTLSGINRMATGTNYYQNSSVTPFQNADMQFCTANLTDAIASVSLTAINAATFFTAGSTLKLYGSI